MSIHIGRTPINRPKAVYPPVQQQNGGIVSGIVTVVRRILLGPPCLRSPFSSLQPERFSNIVTVKPKSDPSAVFSALSNRARLPQRTIKIGTAVNPYAKKEQIIFGNIQSMRRTAAGKLRPGILFKAGDIAKAPENFRSFKFGEIEIAGAGRPKNIKKKK